MSVGSLANTPLVWRRPTYPGSGAARTLTYLGVLQGRVQPRRGTETQGYGRELELTPTVVYLDGKVEVAGEDELELPSGDTLLVRQVHDPDLLGRFTVVECEVQR